MSQSFSWSSSNQRRGIAPISTTFPASQNRSNTSNPTSNSPLRSNFPPIESSHYPSTTHASRSNISRNSSISSTSSPFSPSTGQGIQQQSGLYSARGRTIPSSSNSQLPSVTAAVQGGASGGGGGGSRLSRASPSLSSSSDFGSPQTAHNANTSQPFSASGGASSIDIAQVSIQLARLDKEKDLQKREEGIKSLTTFVGHSMDVLMYTLRKLIRQHSSRIFGSDTSTDPAGSWTVLSNEIEAIRQKPDQAKKIADAIDINEGEPFRDFDLSTFMERFKMDPVSKSMLALSLKGASKSDLKTKADAILSNNLQNLLMTILTPTSETGDDLPPAYLSSLIDRLLQNPPRSWNDESLSNLNFAVRTRYEKLGRPVPTEVQSTMQLAELSGPDNELVRLVQRTGERGTSSLEACKDMLASAETRLMTYGQVASVLLFMVITQNGEAYHPDVFVKAVKDHRFGKRLDWTDIVSSFDRDNFSISKPQFLALYRSLLPLAQEYENFDIQLLWGGNWQHLYTQLSFVVAFLSCTADELDANEIPRLRRAYTIEAFDDASEEVKEYALQAVRHPLVSLDATTALFKMIFQSGEAYKTASNMGIPELVINPHTPYFVTAAAAVPQPWDGLQDQAFDQLFFPFLRKQLDGYNFVFHGIWKHETNWLVQRLVRYHTQEPLLISFIYEHSLEHGWLSLLTGIPSEFGLDLACYAHGHGQFDLDIWLQQLHTSSGMQFMIALSSYIEDKARSDTATQKDPSMTLLTVPLQVDTVYVLLTWLGQYLPEENLIPLYRIAINAYPRLINYGEGHDEIIKENGKDRNSMSADADEAMQDHFKRLYNREIDVKTIIEALQNYKNSEAPGDQELFACMIQGLFDEYSCFVEYPPDALATTAVLFGSIINFNLLSTIALQAGLSMVLEALQSATSREDKMYKFGLQALLNFQNKLQEWPTFCEKLLSLPDLQGTEIYRIADEIVRSRLGAEMNGETTNGLPNGVADDLAASESTAPFASISIDPPLRPEIYRDPDEEIQDRVIFAVNNLSDRNIEEKFADLENAVIDDYHQWFAIHLVEDRAKSQPNYHELFLKLLRLFDNHWLWKEVIRETVVTCVRLLNADSTLQNVNDRNQLKNMGTWLGSLTLARDRPILHRNIAFSDILIEAHKSKRLVVVIPFVCKVLKTVEHSKTFRPPNPWTTEILSILLELYHHIDMKIQMKFEVEVLCKEIGVDMKTIEPSVVIRECDQDFTYNSNEFSSSIPDGLEGFNDLTLANLNRNNVLRGPLGDRFSPSAVIGSLPDISQRLFYPPGQSSNQIATEQTRNIFLQAAEAAIREIIFPVVERSVTIASISAGQLVSKDFAVEPDEEKYRKAAHSTVKSLAGSLALVTCREPLRMSMSNNVRALSRSLSEGLPEGLIVMFVNDNIDIVCKVVEEAAEKQSEAVIDETIAQGLHVRQKYNSEINDKAPFEYPEVSHFGGYLPDPYKPTIGAGLRPEQLAIYENFGPSRSASAHGGNPGQDSRQQLSELPAFDPSVPNLLTPAGEPVVPRQNAQPSRGPMDLGDGVGRLNGFGSGIDKALADILDSAKQAPEESINDLGQGAPTREAYDRLHQFLQSHPPGPVADRTIELTAMDVIKMLFFETARQIEVDVLAQLLYDLCLISTHAGQRVWQSLSQWDDKYFLGRPYVTIALLTKRLVPLGRVDSMLAEALSPSDEAGTPVYHSENHVDAVNFLAELMDIVLLGDLPIALRADFAKSIEALTKWVANEPDNEVGHMLLDKLSTSPPEESFVLPAQPGNKQDQLAHIFDEWIHFVRTEASEKMVVAFVQQMHRHEVLKDTETTANFFRTCLDLCLQAYEAEEEVFGQLQAAYMPIDALAKLIVMLVQYQGEPDGAVKPTRAAYLDSIVSLIALIQTRHFHDRGDQANQKLFFRLYSDLLCGFQLATDDFGDDFEDVMLVFGRLFLALQPKWMPAFTFSWLALVSHRFFMSSMLRMGAQQNGWDTYVALMEIVLKHSDQLLPASIDNPRDAGGYITAVLRVLLLLHHDFQDFLIENHARLCAAIPAQCPQLRNLVNSAYPSTVMELPDPFTTGLKIDRIEDIRRNPVIRLDFDRFLNATGIRQVVDGLLNSTNNDMKGLCHLLANADTNGATIQATVLYIGMQAIAAAGSKGALFNKVSPPYAILSGLTRNLPPFARNLLINAIVNQLRYPNSHTQYFSCVILEIFGAPSGDPVQQQVQEHIAAVLLERLMPWKAHPWGLLVTFLELVKNKSYEFQSLPFVRDNEELWSRPQALQPLTGMAMGGF